jgi:hypothetical protein
MVKGGLYGKRAPRSIALLSLSDPAAKGLRGYKKWGRFYLIFSSSIHDENKMKIKNRNVHIFLTLFQASFLNG